MKKKKRPEEEDQNICENSKTKKSLQTHPSMPDTSLSSSLSLSQDIGEREKRKREAVVHLREGFRDWNRNEREKEREREEEKRRWWDLRILGFGFFFLLGGGWRLGLSFLGFLGSVKSFFLVLGRILGLGLRGEGKKKKKKKKKKMMMMKKKKVGCLLFLRRERRDLRRVGRPFGRKFLLGKV